jgi:hypothetical protein
MPCSHRANATADFKQTRAAHCFHRAREKKRIGIDAIAARGLADAQPPAEKKVFCDSDLGHKPPMRIPMRPFRARLEPGLTASRHTTIVFPRR